MFLGCNKIEKLNIQNFNTSSAKNMCGFFNGCSKLSSIEIFNLDTSQVTDISYMFSGCSNLESLNLENINTSSVKNMAGLFYGCSKINTLNVSNFDTSTVTFLSNMFYGCSNLLSLNLENFNTTSVKNMASLFYGCSKLTSIDISNFETSQVTDISYMFNNCKDLEEIYFGNINTSSVKNMAGLFSGCSKLTSMNISIFDISQVTDISSMFSSCSSLESINYDNINTSSVKKMTSLFSGCSKLTSIDISNFDTSQVTDISYMFNNCKDLKEINFGNIKTSQVKNMRYLFNGCSNLTTIDISLIDTSKVTDISYMFSSCIKLEKINFTNINTSSVKNMAFLFQSCTKLTSLNLTNFDTSQVTDISYMFYSCTNLEKITFGNKKSHLINNIKYLFYACSKLTSIDLSIFDTTRVTDISCMFYSCTNLEKINFGNFNTSSVKNMGNLFQSCSKLSSLDLTNFDTSQVTYLYSMFSGCSNLKYLDLSHFDTKNFKNINYMFYNCRALIFLNLFNFKVNSSVSINYIVSYISPFVKYCINDNETKKYLLGENKESNCFDICFEKNIKLDIINNTCIESCSINGYGYEYNNFCLYRCPKGTLINNNICEDNKCKDNTQNTNECMAETPQGYYYNFEEEVYKKCFYRCKFCNGEGNETNNNCIQCQTNFTFLNDSKFVNNCYQKCEYYYYFDEFGNHFCTENYTCPKNYNKIVISKNKCIDKCLNDNTHIYEYENECLMACPNRTIIIENNICYDENMIESNINTYINQTEKENTIELTETILDYNITSTDIILSDIILFTYINNTEKEEIINESHLFSTYKYINESKDERDEYIENYRNFISDFNISENKEDKVEIKGDVIFQITTSDNQKNSSNKNVSTLDLGDCEKKLKDIYGIPQSMPLLIFKIDYFSPDTLIPIIGYEIYHPLNKTKLDLIYCEDILIKLNIPVSIDESKLFKYDPNSEFYNDNCFSYTTEEGTDIILNDRRQEFSTNNLSLCESNCNYTGYNENNKQSSCDCNVKNKMDLISEIIDNPNKLSNTFDSEESSSSSGSSNIITIKCTKALFSKNGLLNNISSYILLIFITKFLLSIILFMKCGYRLLVKDIDDILNEKEKNKKQIEKNNTLSNRVSLTNGQRIKNRKNNIKKKINYPPKKYKLNFVNKYNFNNENKNPISKKSTSGIKLKSTKINKIKTKTNKNMKKRKPNIFQSKKKTNKKVLPIINTTNKENISISYNDFELNLLDYINAINYDKRTFCENYISLLKIKNLIIFSFCPMKDYNSRIIKLCIFSLSFSIHYVINYAFFNDTILHQIYETGGKYDVLYFLPKIVISLVISYIITSIIKYIFLSERNILKIKIQPIVSQAHDISYKEKKYLVIKYIIFFISSLLFLGFFWLLLSSFGAVYQNTQIFIFKNALISFLISLCLPFFMNFLPCSLRIYSLNSKEKNDECLFKFSKFLQIF